MKFTIVISKKYIHKLEELTDMEIVDAADLTYAIEILIKEANNEI